MSDYCSSRPAFSDRREAGRALANALLAQAHEAPVVLALPRGGVPVAYEVALALQAPLDLLLVRKIGAPGHEEFAIGAVADGVQPHWIVDQTMLEHFHVPAGWFELQKDQQLKEIERRRAIYCGDHRPLQVEGREVIVVDDGVATGNTAQVALMAVAQARPRRISFAVPVGSHEAIKKLEPWVDALVCLVTPKPFRAVGLHYEHFDQTHDEEVIALLAAARRRFSA
ncbi:phosphoribosyltransferase [Pseudomonas capeferrum]|uniref:phosphoribosyltransferase n=1 Tax=Pseudomonas capeferrum TaxID=1495066 RepID=UPI0015E34B35|nr:phosphoribosyltransferase family protein [Pseudomonas capeferrum]MBA1204819.1 phosphoribosyltransferase [Pseudomonas capeferrum]